MLTLWQTHREVSIKDPERRKRGCADKVLIQSAKSKVPRNFSEFLQNGGNKTRLIDLILTVILERKLEVLFSLNSKEIYFSTDGQCHKINRDDVINVPELSSNQEEADTKLCLHARHALNSADRGTVIVRNHSGDVDINVILISKTTDTPERVILDFNKGKYRKVGSRHLKKINLLQFHLFQKSYKQKEEITDHALLHPCHETLRLHCLWSCYVAKIWKSADICSLEAPPVQNHEWDENTDIFWTEKSFPDDFEMILCDVNEEDYYSFEDDSGRSSESESDESDSDD